MTLYRGLTIPPRLLTPKLAMELKTQGSRAPLELVKIGRAQFFTDRYEVAAEKAGANGYILTLELPNDIALDHLQEQTVSMIVKGEAHGQLDNYKFEAEEINRYFDQGRVRLIELNPEHRNEIKQRRR